MYELTLYIVFFWPSKGSSNIIDSRTNAKVTKVKLCENVAYFCKHTYIRTHPKCKNLLSCLPGNPTSIHTTEYAPTTLNCCFKMTQIRTEKGLLLWKNSRKGRINETNTLLRGQFYILTQC